MRILCATATALILFGAAVASVATVPLGPHECIEAALKHSFLLSQHRHLIAADRADITKIRGTTLPYVSSLLQGYELWGNPVSPFTVVGQPLPEIGTFVSGRRTFTIPKAGFVPIGLEQVGVTYPIYYQGSILGLNNPPVVATAIATMTQEQLNTLIVEQQVILDVLNEYIYATCYREQVEIQRQIVDAAREQLEIMQEQVSLGRMLPFQVESARAQLNGAQQVLNSTEASLRAALLQLGTLMGLENQTPELSLAKLPLIQLPPLEPLLEKVMAVHPALRVQQATVEIAHQQLLVDRAGRFPTVTLNSGLSTAQDFDYFNGATTHPRPVEFQSYINIEIPIYDFGQRHAATVESDERYQAARDGVQAVEAALRGSVKEVYNDIMADARTLTDEQSTYTKDNEEFKSAQAQRQTGEIDQLTLIAAKLPVLSDQFMVVSDEMNELLKYAELQNATGGTWRWLQ